MTDYASYAESILQFSIQKKDLFFYKNKIIVLRGGWLF